MHLSRLFLNMKSQMVRSELARPYEMHRTICTRGFGRIPKESLGRILFRVDADGRGGIAVLLVQSDNEPAWRNLPADYLARPAESKECWPQFFMGQRLKFRLRANPTKRLPMPVEAWHGHPSKERARGKRIGLTTDAEQIRWLIRKGAKDEKTGEDGGFRIPGDWLKSKHPITGQETEVPNFRVDARPEGRVRNGKPGHGGEFNAVLFDGILEVTNPEAFLETLKAGIGTAKGFGFGLLSVAREMTSA